MVTRTTSTTRKANLALVPNRIQVQIGTVSTLNAPGHVELNTTTNTFSDIAQNARFNFNGSTVTYYVNTATSSKLSVKRLDGIALDVSGVDAALSGLAGQLVTLTNPIFDLQDTVVTLTKNKSSVNTGTYTNYIGNIYAERNRLEVTYDNFGSNNTNTFIATTLSTSTDVFNNTTDLVSAAFIHNILPFGAVIMWYGDKDYVPDGWAICDGSTVTLPNGTSLILPDFTNRFVVGASDSIGTVDARGSLPGSTVDPTSVTPLHTGGYTDAVIPEHTHSASATFAGSPLEDHTHEAIVNDPGHLHKFQQYELINNGERDNNSQAGENKLQDNTEVGYTGITVDIDPPLESPVPEGTVTVTVDNPSGAVAVEGRNIPPFVALYYIMKISGPNLTNLNFV